MRPVRDSSYVQWSFFGIVGIAQLWKYSGPTVDDTYYLLSDRRTVRSNSRIGMPIGKIYDLLSVYLCVPILFQFIDPCPRTLSGPFIGILLPTQGPVQACSSMGLCVTDSRPS